MLTVAPPFAVRRPSLDDAPAVATVWRAVDVAELGYPDYDDDDAREELVRPGFDPARDAWLVTGADEAPIAYADVSVQPGTTRARGELAVPPPVDDELGRSLLAELQRRTAELARDAGEPALDLDVSADAGPAAAAKTGWLQADGFTPVRRFYRMTRAVGEDPAPALPDGVEVRSVDEPGGADERAFHAVFRDSFAEHWGMSIPPYDDWRRETETWSGVDRSLWLLALVDGEPAGMLLGKDYEPLVWVADLGVLPRFRGRGLGRVLLAAAFARAAALGRSTVALGVDTGNTSPALQLYTSAGMTQESATVIWRRTIAA